MSNYSALFAGLTQEQQLYLQQQNARLMMIRSMNQSSSGAGPSLQSSQSAITGGTTSQTAYASQSLALPALDASPPKVAPTGYYLRRQNDAPSSHVPPMISAPQTLSNASAVHNIPLESITEKPQDSFQSALPHGQPHQTFKSSTDLQQQRVLQQQIQQLQQQYQLQLQAQQQQEQIQAQRQQQIQEDMDNQKLRQMRDEEPNAVAQKSQQAQHLRHKDAPTFSSVRAAAANPAPPSLAPPNLLSLLANPDPSLTFSTFVVFWRQTAHTRREIISKPALWRTKRAAVVSQQPELSHADRSDISAVSMPAEPSQLSSSQSAPKGLGLLSPEPEEIHAHNAAYFKVPPYSWNCLSRAWHLVLPI
jgi:hypothetical protein